MILLRTVLEMQPGLSNEMFVFDKVLKQGLEKLSYQINVKRFFTTSGSTTIYLDLPNVFAFS